jgi:cation transport ATPase
MEVLISVGVFSAYICSVVNLVAGSLHLYFDTAAMLITLLLIGKMLEGGAKRRIEEDLVGVRSLKPTKVRITSAEYPTGHYVSAEHLCTDDVFLIEEDEVIPADGRI